MGPKLPANDGNFGTATATRYADAITTELPETPDPSFSFSLNSATLCDGRSNYFARGRTYKLSEIMYGCKGRFGRKFEQIALQNLTSDNED